MARRLLLAGTALVVWNRSEASVRELAGLGAAPAARPSDVFDRADIVLVMLADAPAIDSVLERGSATFAAMVRGRTLVHMGTTAPAYSEALAADVRAAGGRYVEAPVSGSRVPAEQGQLVAMLAGDEDVLDRVEGLIAPMCARIVRCGAVPGALTTKLAINLFLITMVTGLAEAAHFAAVQGVDPELFRQVHDAGPMASAVSRGKLDMLVRGEFPVQAALRDVRYNSELVVGAARAAGVATPLMDAAAALFREAVETATEPEDMAAVVRALQARTATVTESRGELREPSGGDRRRGQAGPGGGP